MATYTYPKDRPAHTFHHWRHIRPNRRSARVGKQLGMPSIHSRFISFTSLHTHVLRKLQVSEMTFDYTDCWNLQNSTAMDNLTFFPMPSYSYDLRASDREKSVTPPTYAYFYDPTALPNQTHSCIIQFDIVADLQAPVFQYYKLTNFYQNNRRYVQSLDTSQLQGAYVDVNTLSGGNCKPLAVTSDGTKGIYPCGLIANSVFNGTFVALLIIVREFTCGLTINTQIRFLAFVQLMRPTRPARRTITLPRTASLGPAKPRNTVQRRVMLESSMKSSLPQTGHSDTQTTTRTIAHPQTSHRTNTSKTG